MPVMILAAAALSASASPTAVFPPREPAPAARGTAESCLNLAPRFADEDWASRSRSRRLIELPPGRLELAVHREVEGCAIPAVLRDGIGGAAPERDPRR